METAKKKPSKGEEEEKGANTEFEQHRRKR
jgi:hypothetical protein